MPTKPKAKRPPTDLVIVGGSAAGVSAAIYAARRKLRFKMITGDIGGEIITSGEIENYPGIPKTTGFELTQAFKEHLASYDIKPEEDVWVEKIVKKGKVFEIQAKRNGRKKVYKTSAVILSTGVHPRKLGVPGEEEFDRKGISYCTTCDGPLFQGKNTVTVGGGNSALESAIMMSGIAKKHFVLNINPAFGGDKTLIDKVNSLKNVTVIHNAATTEIMGETFVNGIEYKDVKSGKVAQLDVQGVMVHIGWIPNSGPAPKKVRKNPFGEIMVDQSCRTNVPGFFAAGDVTDIPYKQIGISVGCGISAALAATDYLDKL